MGIVAVDFDGVINSYTSGWNKDNPLDLPDPPVPGALQFLIDLHNAGHKVVIFTSRARYDGAQSAILGYLLRGYLAMKVRRREYEDFLVNVEVTAVKPPAFVTLDDRAITFTGTFPSMEEIETFKPWNKRG